MKTKIGVTKGVTRKPKFLMTNSQRTKIKLAKINTKTGKSAINEIGRTVRDVAGQITAQKAYTTYANKEIAKQRSANINSNNVDQTIELYNKLISGNAGQEGEKGETSITQVGGAGSAIGG